MKPFLAALVFAVLAVQSVKADWVIIQKSNADGKDQEVTMKVKGDMARSDMGEKMSVILDGASGKVTVLMHEQKSMMKMDADSMKSMMAMAGNLLGGKDKKAAKPTPTGQMEKVGKYDAEIFTWSGAIGTGKFWVAKDFPHAAELNAVQDKIMKAMGNPAATFAPASGDFPGMVVKSELSVMGKAVIGELVSVTEQPVDAAIFTLPVDYKELKMPALPGGK